MPVKIKGLTKFKRRTKKVLPDARSNFAKEMKRIIVDIIVEKVISGLSPVKGQNRYKEYSTGYAKTKGRKSPVDLVGEGKMLENMRARQTSKNDIIIEFPSAKENKKASYHNEGTDTMPQRKILPSGNEVFKSDIMSKIIKTLENAISKALK